MMDLKGGGRRERGGRDGEMVRVGGRRWKLSGSDSSLLSGSLTTRYR